MLDVRCSENEHRTFNIEHSKSKILALSPGAPQDVSMPKPVIALVGDEPFLQLQKLQQIIAQFPADVQRIDLDGTRAELADVLDELRSFAMFGSAKLVVV